jgi:hypothetical protein
MSIAIGIISYFPDKQPDRDLRIGRFNSLLSTLDYLWPELPVIVVAQNWGDYVPKKELIIHSFGKLGILNARRKLREIFLNSDYNNLITLDDDVIIDGQSGKEFLMQINNNPNGMGVFCWEHSQLNLLYISKYIYSQVDLPDVDPEKDEGFEDVVFVHTCKQKFPDRVFTFKSTGLTETSFRYTGEGKVPSTWAGNPHDWKKLRNNTKEIKDKLEKNISSTIAITSVIKKKIKIQDKIDIVVPYVDSSDQNWQELYNQHAPKTFREDSNGKQRFRGNELFKYWFRSVDMYLPWINKIFVIVQSDSQIPTWLLNTDRIKVIKHEQFIPNEYLPVFNSQAIEMFIHKIPELSEKFLYSNDDIYYIGSLEPEDYFTETGVKTNFKCVPIGDINNIPLWKVSIINSGLLTNKEETEKIRDVNLSYITPMHITRPYLKFVMEEAFNLYKTEILNSITKFREFNNFSIYLYDFYMKNKGLVSNKDYNYFHYSNKISPLIIGNTMANSNTNKVMCLNDTSETVNKQRENNIKQKFIDKYPKKSQFEV